MNQRTKRLDTGKLSKKTNDLLILEGLLEMRKDYVKEFEEIRKFLDNNSISYSARRKVYELCLAHYDCFLGSVFLALWYCEVESIKTHKKAIRNYYKKTCDFSPEVTNILLEELTNKRIHAISRIYIPASHTDKKKVKSGRIATKAFVKNMAVGKMVLENEASSGMENSLAKILPDEHIVYYEAEKLKDRSKVKYGGPFDGVVSQLYWSQKNLSHLFIRLKPEFIKATVKARTKEDILKLDELFPENYLDPIFPFNLNYSEAEKEFFLTLTKN